MTMSGPIKRALTVAEARAAVLADVVAITASEMVALSDAPGRVLAEPLAARLTQPPFHASAMDGYAVRSADIASLPAALRVSGTAAAGRSFSGVVTAGCAVRIFTGAPVPDGADAIVIQENTRRDGDTVTVLAGRADQDHIRPRGGDFSIGDTLIPADRRLNARDVTLAAAMGHATLRVRRKPRVALLATGDELVPPGDIPGPDQIVCSTPFGVAALIGAAGAEPVILGIARDTAEDLAAHVARAADADVLITLGGASVGDHDLVAPVLGAMGLSLDFWTIAMRPGKPLMFGRLGAQAMLGLPGNPVSSLICARLFAVPLVRALLGVAPGAEETVMRPTAVALAANGPREHYMRATTTIDAAGQRRVTPVRSQDSSLLAPLAAADCLIVRPIHGPAIDAGGLVPVLALDA
jgi:molybdopterin molybdotransferase